jgi:hypothetical protein
MSVNILFVNGTTTPVTFEVMSSGNLLSQFNCNENATTSGTVTGAASYQVSCRMGEGLITPQFTGDTEIVFTVFTQPNSQQVDDSNESE